MSKDAKHSTIYPGKVRFFKTMMDGLGNEYTGVWVSSSGEGLEFFEPKVNETPVGAFPRFSAGAAHSGYTRFQVTPTRYNCVVRPSSLPSGKREVKRYEPPECAGIEAYEQPVPAQ